MKTNKIRVLVLAVVGLLAAGASVSPAAAQGIVAAQGKFRLTSEVRWQDKVLPAGDYSFVLQSASMPAVVELRGPSGASVILTAGMSTDNKDQTSFLTIERHGDSGYVREMYLAPLGIHFRYRIPKMPKEELLAQQPATTERVLISAVTK